MASISIENASVSYFLRRGNKKLKEGSVGARILEAGRYLEIAALRDVSVEIKHNDRVGLIGLNGSGKSTLLKLCAGALALKSGSMNISGRVTPQFSLSAGIRAPLSGRRNAELKCLYLGTPQSVIGDRVEEVKELSGLGPYFELPVSSYSAGMRSRLVMSLMRLVRPEILIMDEWIGAADPTVNKTAGALQHDLASSASILIIASHSQRVLEQWTHTLLWLDRGEVRMTGPTAEVFAAYNAWMESQN